MVLVDDDSAFANCILRIFSKLRMPYLSNAARVASYIKFPGKLELHTSLR